MSDRAKRSTRNRSRSSSASRGSSRSSRSRSSSSDSYSGSGSDYSSDSESSSSYSSQRKSSSDSERDVPLEKKSNPEEEEVFEPDDVLGRVSAYQHELKRLFAYYTRPTSDPLGDVTRSTLADDSSSRMTTEAFLRLLRDYGVVSEGEASASSHILPITKAQEIFQSARFSGGESLSVFEFVDCLVRLSASISIPPLPVAQTKKGKDKKHGEERANLTSASEASAAAPVPAAPTATPVERLDYLLRRKLKLKPLKKAQAGSAEDSANSSSLDKQARAALLKGYQYSEDDLNRQVEDLLQRMAPPAPVGPPALPLPVASGAGGYLPDGVPSHAHAHAHPYPVDAPHGSYYTEQAHYPAPVAMSMSVPTMYPPVAAQQATAMPPMYMYDPSTGGYILLQPPAAPSSLMGLTINPSASASTSTSSSSKPPLPPSSKPPVSGRTRALAGGDAKASDSSLPPQSSSTGTSSSSAKGTASTKSSSSGQKKSDPSKKASSSSVKASSSSSSKQAAAAPSSQREVKLVAQRERAEAALETDLSALDARLSELMRPPAAAAAAPVGLGSKKHKPPAGAGGGGAQSARGPAPTTIPPLTLNLKAVSGGVTADSSRRKQEVVQRAAEVERLQEEQRRASEKRALDTIARRTQAAGGAGASGTAAGGVKSARR